MASLGLPHAFLCRHQPSSMPKLDGGEMSWELGCQPFRRSPEHSLSPLLPDFVMRLAQWCSEYAMSNSALPPSTLFRWLKPKPNSLLVHEQVCMAQ